MVGNVFFGGYWVVCVIVGVFKWFFFESIVIVMKVGCCVVGG